MSPIKDTLQKEFEHRLRFESMLADLTARFVGLRSEQVHDEIAGALQQLCDFLGFDRSTVWEFDPAKPEEAHLKHFSQIPGGPPIPEEVKAVELFPWVNQQTRAGNEVVLERMADLPEEAAVDRESFRRFRSKSTVALPLRVGGESIGIVSFAVINHERAWPEEILTRLRLCAQVFANAISRRRIDMALRESEERLSLATESAGAGLWSVDLASRRVWANARLHDLFELPHEGELTLESLLDAIHPEDRPAVGEAVDEAVQRGENLEVEFRTAISEGKQRWLSAHGRCQGETETGCDRLVGLTYEITERRQAEEILRDLNRRLIRAHEEERARLARELHDDLTQRLARMAIDLGRPALVKKGTSEASTVRSVRDGLAQLSEDVHTLAYRLHPTILEDLGLVEALRSECEQFEQRESIQVAQDFCSAAETVSWEALLSLFRVAQECLRNVARHAQATQVVVSLCQSEDGLSLSVRDDGVGFDTSDHPELGHLGIAGMRERMSLVSGSFDITSVPGEGTAVYAWTPTEESS